MTTLVALATKDALIMGCDSLASITTKLISPFKLIKYFDPDKEFRLRLDKDGNPLLKSFSDIYTESTAIPAEHMTHMMKLFSLDPLKMGVMITGIASIGERTIKSLIEEFKKDILSSIETTDYTVENIATEIMNHILKYYRQQIEDEKLWPDLELILGGYGKKEVIPEIYRIKLPGKGIERQLKEGHFGIVFGGQMKEIARIVWGIDFLNRFKISQRYMQLLKKYSQDVKSFLDKNDIKVDIPVPYSNPSKSDELLKEYELFSDELQLEGFDANWGDFSEQNAIECVDFFVNIMIKSQQFSIGMPTVGGEVHIALINRDKFKFISKEEYFHSGHSVPKHEL